MFITFLQRGVQGVFVFQGAVLTVAIVRLIILNGFDWLAIPILGGIWGFAWLMVVLAGRAAAAMRGSAGRS